MGEQVAGILDVTIVYRPSNKPLLRSFASGEQAPLAIHAELLPIQQDVMAGDYNNDKARSRASPMTELSHHRRPRVTSQTSAMR